RVRVVVVETDSPDEAPLSREYHVERRFPADTKVVPPARIDPYVTARPEQPRAVERRGAGRRGRRVLQQIGAAEAGRNSTPACRERVAIGGLDVDSANHQFRQVLVKRFDVSPARQARAGQATSGVVTEHTAAVGWV